MLVSFAGLAILIVILILGVPLGFSMMAVGFLGFSLFRGLDPSFEMAGQQIVHLSTSFSFTTLPLFILMGVFMGRAELSDDLYEAAYAWLGHFRGGLAMATVAACGGFSAVSGSSIATAATMAKVALPSMRRYRYAEGFAAGTVAAGGTLGILIPPSAALIIYGILTEQDIGALFVAGIVPGLLTITLYIFSILIVTSINPELGPQGQRSGWAHRFASLYRVWGVLVLFLVILGGIFLGLFTPTEAGAIGAVGAFVFAVLRRRMTLRILFDSLVETSVTTATVFTVAFGALILNNFVNIAGLTSGVSNLINGLDLAPIYVMLIILAMYVVLGMFIEGLSMIFLTVPIFVPIVHGLGFDLNWFGIMLVIVVEVSLITPPIGLNVFVIKSMLPDVPLSAIFRGIVPFFAADICRILVVLFFPEVVLFLPRLMG